MKINKVEGLSCISLTIILTAFLISSLGYHGFSGNEYYSPINHLISELGNSLKSTYYYIYNWSMILGGILLFFALISIQTKFKFILFLLKISIIGIIGIGLFPENYNISMHLLSAVLFFAGSGCCVAILGYESLRNKNSPYRVRTVSISIISFFCFICLMLLPKSLLTDAIRLQKDFVRPSIWWLAIIEWSYIFCLTIWGTCFLRIIRTESDKNLLT